MISLYIYLKRFFLNLNGLSDASVASLTKKEYGSAVHLLKILMKSLKSMSDEWFNAIFQSSISFEIFLMKKWVELSLKPFGTLKYDCVIKTIERFNLLPLIKHSVTTEFSFFY